MWTIFDPTDQSTVQYGEHGSVMTIGRQWQAARASAW